MEQSSGCGGEEVKRPGFGGVGAAWEGNDPSMQPSFGTGAGMSLCRVVRFRVSLRHQE